MTNVESAIAGLRWLSPIERSILRNRLTSYVKTRRWTDEGSARVTILESLGYAMIGAIVTMTGGFLFVLFLVLSVTVWSSTGGSDLTRTVCDIFYVIGWLLIVLGCFRAIQSVRLRRRAAKGN
jgi:hypothetical protein